MHRKIFLLTLLAVAFLYAVSFAGAQEEPAGPPSPSTKIVKAVEIKGNKAISTSTIMAKIKTRVGLPYYSQNSRDDIKRLYETGFFADISLELQDIEGGLKVIFKVEERPIIGEVQIQGNHVVTRALLLQKMKSKVGQYLNLSLLKEDVAALKQEYERRGIPEATVAQGLKKDPATNKTTIIMTITEGKRVKIKKIYVDENYHFSDNKILTLIKTRPAWFFNAGFFKEDQFDDDLERIKGFYLKNGYLDVKVDYRIDYDTQKNLYIRITVEEGRQYSVGKITIKGSEKFTEKEVGGALKACLEGGVFSYEALKDDVTNIQGFYFGKGYIFVQVKDSTSLDTSTGKVDISYDIVENEVAYVDRVEIRGNEKTQDKVIRRELRIKPGERFDGDKLKRTKERLYNLGFFEDINYDTEPGTEPNQRNLIVDVKEAKTGSFSFGGGYSSVDQLIGFVEIEQKNFDWRNWKTFTGAGQDLKLRGEIGSITKNFELNFTEPWTFDYPISSGFDLYQRVHNADQDVGYGYSEKRTGGDIRLGKDFTEYIKGGATYRLEQVHISDVDSTATQDLLNEVGYNIISSLEFSLTRDTTDNVFNPSRGLVLSGSYEVAGGPLGGDKSFNKFFALASQYFPLFAKGVLQIQARGGYVAPFGDSPTVPIYERFFAGGAETIRGYEERGVGPVDPLSNDPLGGDLLCVANIEYTYPIVDFLKVAFFIDTGNVWAKPSDFTLGSFKTGFGPGVRIKTPMGPLKLDYGIPINKTPNNPGRSGQFHFSMSHGF